MPQSSPTPLHSQHATATSTSGSSSASGSGRRSTRGSQWARPVFDSSSPMGVAPIAATPADPPGSEDSASHGHTLAHFSLASPNAVTNHSVTDQSSLGSYTVGHSIPPQPRYMNSPYFAMHGSVDPSGSLLQLDSLTQTIRSHSAAHPNNIQHSHTDEYTLDGDEREQLIHDQSASDGVSSSGGGSDGSEVSPSTLPHTHSNHHSTPHSTHHSPHFHSHSHPSPPPVRSSYFFTPALDAVSSAASSLSSVINMTQHNTNTNTPTSSSSVLSVLSHKSSSSDQVASPAVLSANSFSKGMKRSSLSADDELGARKKDDSLHEETHTDDEISTAGTETGVALGEGGVLTVGPAGTPRADRSFLLRQFNKFHPSAQSHTAQHAVQNPSQHTVQVRGKRAMSSGTGGALYLPTGQLSVTSGVCGCDRYRHSLNRRWKHIPLDIREKLLFILSSLMGTAFFFVLFECCQYTPLTQTNVCLTHTRI